MKKLLTPVLELVSLPLKSKSKITKIFVWTQHLISECTKGSRLTLQGLKLFTISLAVFFPATVAFAQAVSFSPATNFLVGSLHPASVAIGDLNGDGKPDLATANIFGDNVSILLGTGTGGFGAATTFAVGSSPRSVAIADVNGDGKPDLAVANRGGNVSILLGIGTGSFGAATNFAAGIRPISVAIGDLNGDGKPDLATANSGFVDDVSILLGDGAGTFGAATSFVAGASPNFVAIGDLNGDGKPDLAVVNSYTSSNNVSILLGTGTGAFGAATNFAVGTGPQSVAIADLNGDGKPDLAVANEVSHNVSILLGTGTGAFGTATNLDVGAIALSVAIADLNGDRKPDLAVTGGKAAVSILLGTGTGAFGAATDFAGPGSSSVAIGDLNGDGKPDLAVTNNQGNSVSILLNTMTCAPGGPFVVNSTADVVDANPGNGCCATAGGVCTLRAAIMEANALAGADIITLPAGTYSLTIPGVNEDFNATGDLDITSDLTITGAGANITTIDGGGIDRVFDIRPVNTTNVLISGLTVTGGKTLTTQPGGGTGGGIKSQGTLLTLTNVTVDNNVADNGGGIFVGGAVTLNNCAVINNQALAGGFGAGGILNYIHGPLTLNNSTVSGNQGGFAGGIVTTSWASPIFLNNSTVSFNTGGLYNAAGSVTMKNTILANPSGNCTFQGGTLTSLGNNLSTDTWCAPAHVSGGLNQPTDLNNTAAQLAPLALNLPGSTKTHALLPGSPAIDKGGDCLAMDQRGVPRPQGAACDIGAYEAGASCSPTPTGLVAWWPMDEIASATSLQDIIGGNNAILFESPVGAAQAPQPVTGKVGGAIHYPQFGSNGLSGSRAIPQEALVNIGAADFTIEAWVQVPTAPANRVHYIVNRFDITQNRGYALYVVSPGKAGDERLEFKWGDGTNVSTVQTMSSLATGQWHHVAVTFGRNIGGFALDLRLYLNGAEQGRQTVNPPGLGSLANFLTLEIGCEPSTIDEPITIDELAIFNRVLLQSEIQAIFNAGSAGKCKTIVSVNHSPVANAGPDQTVEATSPSGASVTLNGSGSSDPDSNPLTYTWTGPFGTVSVMSPTVTLPLGTHTVTLKVNDGQATATDTVNITVRDTTPPDTIISSAVDGNGAAVASGGSTLSGSITLTFGGTDIVGVAGFQCSRDGSGFAACTSSASYSPLAKGSHTFQVRALDAAGNVDPSPASFTWTIVTPAQAIENLINTIGSMGLPGGVATSLTAPLSNINTNNKAAACGKLNAFINQVDAKVQNGQLTADQASQLLTAANAIKAGLGC